MNISRKFRNKCAKIEKEANSDLKIAAELLGFHLCESFERKWGLPEEICRWKRKTFIRRIQNLTEDVKEHKMIIRTTDKLVETIYEQEKQIENFRKVWKK